MKKTTGVAGPDPPPYGDDPVRGVSRLASYLLAGFFALALRLLARSWRTEVSGLEHLEGLLLEGKRVLVIFWHGKYVPFFTLCRGRSARVFSSRSFRGEVIFRLCRHFGYDGRMIPGHGGEKVLALMREALEGRQLAAVAPDGPEGPRHRVKHGVIRLAIDLEMILLPLSVAARPRLVLARRWDRLEIPLPFSRVRMVIGEPIRIPRDSGHSIGWWKRRVADELQSAGKQAEGGLKRKTD